MFMIVSYSRWENTHKVFDNFKDAFEEQQKYYPDWCIEEYIGSKKYIVWNPSWLTKKQGR